MTLTLFGSQTSPYVRRIRLVLAQQAYQFSRMNILDEQDRAILSRYNPTYKIPMLLDDDTVIFDSGVIYRYLAGKLKFKALGWYQENQLTVINAVNDSLVILYQGSRSGFDMDEDRLLFNLQKERIAASLFVLEQQCEAGEFANWDYPAMALYSLVDWILFRELIDMEAYPALLAFQQQNSQQEAVAQTDPRLG
ncbi:glutathione S-transferase [Chromatiaceae bacterium AAb-1]|nr:glutathione S-transferase [Chromatiaceae bacterium AAb-1]